MFFGRNKELESLMGLWDKAVASLVTCRGRRRIGKSTLIEEFARRSKAHFMKLEGRAPGKGVSSVTQLDAFAADLSSITGKNTGPFTSWSSAFAALDASISAKGRTVILLDEISWMSAGDNSFPGELKVAWDNRFKRHEKLILVLCGSVSTWITDNILNNTGFLGRASLNLSPGELSLSEACGFWGEQRRTFASGDILDVLSVTGCVPKYLEEVNPGISAQENIRRICFLPDSPLLNDFTQIFSDVFGENALTKRQILQTLSNGPRSAVELAAALKIPRNGHLTRHLNELELSGFISANHGVSPRTGKALRKMQYRLRDNYTRFFMHFMEPRMEMIRMGAFETHSLEELPGWETIMGLQFESLVLNNVQLLLPKLGLARTLIYSAAPFRSTSSEISKGVQIDLLIQTRNSCWIVEIKRQREIGEEIETQVREKVKRLHAPKSMSVRTALVYLGHLSPVVQAGGFFDAIVPAGELLA